MSVLLLIPTVVRSATAWRTKWETALTGVGSAPATVLCLGDSITEGQGASVEANRWTRRLNDYLQGKYNTGSVGGAGWLASDPAVFGPYSPWSLFTSQTGTVTQLTTVGTPGYRAVSMATSATRTYTLTGTSVDIYWQRASGNGSFTWAVDGGSATSVSTAGTASVLTKTTVTLGATVGGSHTLVLTATTGPVVLEGLFVYNGDETHGPRVWEAGHSAWDSDNIANHADYTNFAAFVGAIAPDLVTIQFGFNDYLHNTVTPAQFQTNLAKILTTLDGLANRPSILLIDSYDSGTNPNGNTATQDDYRIVLLNLVSADPDYRGYINFGDTMPATDFTGSGYYQTDAIHPNDSGYNEINRQIAIAVTPWSAPGPITETATVVATGYQSGTITTGVTTLATDTFTGTNGTAPSSQWTITANGGTATIQSNALQLDTVVTSAYTEGPRAFLSGMTATADTDLLFSFKFTTTGEQYHHIWARADLDTANGNAQPNNGYEVFIDTNGNYFAVQRLLGGVSSGALTLTGSNVWTWTANTKYWIRFRLIADYIAVSVWADGSSEPASPNGYLTDTSPYLAAGKVAFQSLNGATGPRPAIIDDVTVTDGGTAVVAPPTARPGQLAGWHAAVEYRSYTTATWLAIGDSITEGQGASTRTNRWIDQALATIRTRFPTTAVTGGVGYLPAYNVVYGPESPWTPYTSRSGTITDGTSLGFGGRTSLLAIGATVTYTISGDAFDVWWVSNASAGSLTVTIDGTLISSIATAGTTSGDHRNRFVVSSGSHTVVIGCTGATATLAGIQVFNGDKAKGIRLIDSAHVSWKTTDFQTSGFVAPWASASPDLVTIELGFNDVGVPTSPATVKANLKSIISSIRAALPTKPPSIVVCVPYGTDDVTWSWDAYAFELRRIADEDPTVGILDFYRPMGPITGPSYWSTDGVHPNDAGHTFMGALAADFLTVGEVTANITRRDVVQMTHVASSAWVAPASSTTLTLTYPTGLAAPTGLQQDCVYAFLHIKPDTATVATPTNWTLVGSASGGGGSQGIGTGPTRVHVYKRLVPSGGLSGTEVFTITGGDSPQGYMRAYRATGQNLTFAETYSSWSVAAASTTFGGTAAAGMFIGAWDELVVVIGAADDQPGTTGLAMTGITVSGLTLGTPVQDPTGTSINAQGNDISATTYRVPVNLANSSSAPVVTATCATAETGMGFLLRVRATAEDPSPPLPPPAPVRPAPVRSTTW